MESPHETIIPFDREYTLKDLLPTELVLGWARAAPRLGVAHLSVIMADGTSLAPEPSEKKVTRAIGDLLAAHRPETRTLGKTHKGWVVLTPLVHELEILGYLALGYNPDGNAPTEALDAAGTLLGTAITQILKSGCGLAMASQVHGEVVEETFAVLKEKATQLAKSEKKYRLLATSLDREVKRKAEEIHQAQERLMQQEKMASIGQLAAGVAHEINNPMGFITSNINSLEEYAGELIRFVTLQRDLIGGAQRAGLLAGENEARLLKELQHVDEGADIDFILKDIPPLLSESIDGAERIRKIVQDLKDFAHPGEEKLSLADLNANLDKSINIVGSELKYKATLEKNYRDLPPVQCYPRQLDQVFVNLLVNAAQAITDKGTITVSTCHDSTHAIVAIADTGTGIPKGMLKKIFDPFYTTKPVGKGTGLGLNVVYNIVKRHRGSISVKSEEGRGTTFTLRLPLHRAPPAEEQEP
ncbi:ATP-binding protein [Desulfoluna spongiiphila]|uniref:ATP-binding protein n=1 Tax=Desulfoluna spongiiphila TaxID=419481 RepID=UPI00125AF9C2|nr:ATP-binding protein [Desulfoluna spongiiphila]VVS93233.1 histidine kinase domain [Desulfoluna spongiiphila]